QRRAGDWPQSHHAVVCSGNDGAAVGGESDGRDGCGVWQGRDEGAGGDVDDAYPDGGVGAGDGELGAVGTERDGVDPACGTGDRWPGLRGLRVGDVPKVLGDVRTASGQ